MTYVDWFYHRRLHGEITADASYHPRRSRSRLLPSDHTGHRGHGPIARAATLTGRLGRHTSSRVDWNVAAEVVADSFIAGH